MRQSILMIVKTYPTPSKTNGEIVCTAGINVSTGEWVRIYPYPFRTADQYAKFAKYETFEFDLEKADARDKRPESHRLIDLDSARKVAEVISTKGSWRERMAVLVPTRLPSVQQMMDQLYDSATDTFGRSLAPIQVEPGSAVVTFERDAREWDAKSALKLQKAKEDFEGNLFVTSQQLAVFKTLEKLPFKVRLTFRDLTGAGHSLLVTDWEIGVLFLKERGRLGEEGALESVKNKIENDIFAPDKDTHVILGSVFGHLKNTTLVVVGFAYPKRIGSPTRAVQESFF